MCEKTINNVLGPFVRRNHCSNLYHNEKCFTIINAVCILAKDLDIFIIRSQYILQMLLTDVFLCSQCIVDP